VQLHPDAPFGGLPTLAYSRLFAQARAEGVVVLLDGQGMDEQWAGYDYYVTADHNGSAAVVQGTGQAVVKPACLMAEFRTLAETLDVPARFPDGLRRLQYRDIRHTKIPRALRFNDRVSMQYSTELREPFLDHRLVELALRQPPDRKLQGGVRKVLLRQLAQRLVPSGIVEAPKRPVGTALTLGIRSVRQYPLLAAVLFAATLSQGGLQGLLLWVLRDLLRSLGERGMSSPALVGGTGLVLTIWTLRSATTFVADLVQARIAYRVEVTSMQRVLAKLLTLSVRFFERSGQGDLVMAAYQDLKGVRTVIMQLATIALSLSRLLGLG